MKMHINTLTSWLLIVLLVSTACQDEDDPLTACISYDESKSYSVGQKLNLRSCTDGAASYEWVIEGTVLTGKDVTHVIRKNQTNLIVELTVTDQNGMSNTKPISIPLGSYEYYDDIIVRRSLPGFEAKKARFLVTPDNSIFAYGASYERQFTANLNFSFDLQSFTPFDFDTLSVIKDRAILKVFPLPEGGYMAVEAYSTGRVYDEDGYVVRTLHIHKYDENLHFKSNTDLPIIARANTAIPVEKENGFFVATDSRKDTTALTTLDKNGALISVTYLKSSMAEKTVLISFIKNMKAGYTLILENTDSDQLIRMDINEEGEITDEYLLPFTDVNSYYTYFYADGDILIMSTSESINLLEGPNLKWSTPTKGVLVAIVPGEEGKYLCISDGANVTVIDQDKKLYSINYAINRCESVLQWNGYYYLAGVVREGYYGDEKMDALYFIKINPDASLVAE